jgi:lipoprotein signal peptidase
MTWKRILAVSCALVAVIFDRLLKWHSFAALPGEGAILMPGFEYKYFLNSGLTFSLFNNPIAIIASLVAAFALVFWLVWKLRREPSWILSPINLAGVLLVILGGASNLFDRFYFRGVIDYLLFFSRSAWNIADIMILAGILLLVLKRDSKGGLSVMR